jgi:hypothetical protein
MSWYFLLIAASKDSVDDTHEDHTLSTFLLQPNHNSLTDDLGSVQIKMFQSLWLWRQEYQHHEQLPLAFNGTWPSWNSDLDNRPW